MALSAASPKSFITIAGEITPTNPQQPKRRSEDPTATQAPWAAKGGGTW